MQDQPYSDLLQWIDDHHDIDKFHQEHWQGSFAQYLNMVEDNPKLSRTAYQRIYDMILSYGYETYIDGKKKITKYHFFSDPIDDGKDAVFGLDISLMKLVNVFKSAALGLGPEKRVLLLHGPVGSSKSTIVRMIKKGLEAYSKTAEGALYTFAWKIDPNEIPNVLADTDTMLDPMHADPLLLIPQEFRSQVFEKIAEKHPDHDAIQIKGDVCPASRQVYQELMSYYDGDWAKVMQHVVVKRLILSEKDRVGIGTFQPKDEKNQDSTELTGDINYRLIAKYGSDSDPRAFNFDGEFNVANRGIVEFVEVLKLDVAFLYDLLGASQEHTIKPKKFPQTDIDEVIIGHTNEPEYRKLQSNEFMEALRDRTIKIDIPYITKLSEEMKIYQKDYNQKSLKDKHIAPHTLEMAAMWAILTRLEQPKKSNLSLLQKLKLYDGRAIPGYTEDNIRELRKEAVREGLDGVSPRYVQDKISNTLVNDDEKNYINPFMVLKELESGLKRHSLISNEEDRKHYSELINVVKEEYADIVKAEVQRALSTDDGALSKLCANYIDHVKAYTQNEKVKNSYTGSRGEPDERLMRSIEEKIDIAESRKDDFRREIMNYIGALSLDGKKFDYKTNDRLNKALELKLFEDQKDSIKLTSLVSSVVDEETQKKIDVVKKRLINHYGYNEDSASDVLQFVASIFARGDVKSKQ
ncbi:serine protein kinase [bacterium]|nr:serine protein kinase [bacterium]